MAGNAMRSDPSTLQVANRVVAALLGGYAFTWGLTALALAALFAVGVNFHEAEVGVYLLAFVVYLGLFLWAFAAKSLTRVWTLFGVGAVVTTAAAWALQRAVLG